MKKLKLSLDLILIVSFSACTLKGNIELNVKDKLIGQLKVLRSHKGLTPITETSNKELLTVDFKI